MIDSRMFAFDRPQGEHSQGFDASSRRVGVEMPFRCFGEVPPSYDPSSPLEMIQVCDGRSAQTAYRRLKPA